MVEQWNDHRNLMFFILGFTKNLEDNQIKSLNAKHYSYTFMIQWDFFLIVLEIKLVVG